MRLAPIFRMNDYVFVDSSPLFCSATEQSDLKGCKTFFSWTQGLHKVGGVNNDTLQFVQNEFENKISIYCTTLGLTWRRYCGDDPSGKEKRRSNQVPC